jgi:hypothetical protein
MGISPTKKYTRRDMMKTIIKVMTILLVIGIFMAPVFSFAEFTSVGGEWLITLSGREQGTTLLQFGVPSSGISTITGIGFIQGMEQSFVVKEGSAQQLNIESDGNMVGDIEIEDADGVALGTLSIDHGKANRDFTKLSLKGTFTEAGGSPKKVNLKGIRLPDTIPVLEGYTYTGKISGGRLKSKFFPLSIIENEELEGYPFLSMIGIGPVEIDGEETPSVDMSSDFIVDQKGNVVGDFYSSSLGSGELEGTLKPGDEGPKLKFKVTISEPKHRRFTISTKLNPAVGAKLVVTPATNPVDFGTTKKEVSKNQIFILTNTGGEALSGSTTLEGAGAGEFSILSGSPYEISPTQTATVTVQFKAQNTGSFNAQIKFTGDVDGDLIINISATATSN